MSIRFEIYSFSGVGGESIDDRTTEAEFGNPVIASGDVTASSWQQAFVNPGPHAAMAIIRNATVRHEVVVSDVAPAQDAPCVSVAPNEIVRRLVRAGSGLYLRASA